MNEYGEAVQKRRIVIRDPRRAVEAVGRDEFDDALVLDVGLGHRSALQGREECGIRHLCRPLGSALVEEQDDFCDDNIEVVMINEDKPVTIGGELWLGGCQYIYPNDGTSISVPVWGGDFYAVDMAEAEFDFENPEELVASIMGIGMYIIDDLKLPADFCLSEQELEDLDNYSCEFNVVNEEASGADFPVRLHRCTFSCGKKVDIDSEEGLMTMMRDWLVHPEWGSLHMVSYTECGDW